MVEQLQAASDTATQTQADPEDVFCEVFTTFLRGVDQMRRFILLAYQETKSLNPATRQTLMEREQRLQAALGRVISHGVERGAFAPNDIELKAHNLMVLAHTWAVRHWAFQDKVDSIDDYIAFLLPQALALLRPTQEVRHQPRKRPAPLDKRLST